jgi:hypothetical protein
MDRAGITYQRSPRKHKKLVATLPDGRKVHFGDTRYQHYRDKTGILSGLDHNDPERRRRYRARHGTDPPLHSPAWFALNVLW